MNYRLPFFNWSLSKALDTQPDILTRARIRIVYTILLFSLVKIFIVIGIGWQHEQWRQVIRAVIMGVIYIAATKYLLYKPSAMKTLVHIMIVVGVVVVWTNIFLYTHKINVLTVQFVFMILLSSFYITGIAMGTLYSVMAILPVFLLLVGSSNVSAYFSNAPQEFASPGYEIIVMLNFISLAVAHYLFYKAFNTTLNEREALNRKLQLSIEEANKLAAARSNFLSTISHELRTPLNSVVGMTELLLQDKPGEHQLENLKILRFSALDLLSLINNVLDFNKMDSDKLTLEAIPFRLSEFMKNISSALRVKAIDKRLDFILDIDERLENMTVVSDPTRLSQVIYNLVGNALKFTEKGSITIRLEHAGQAGSCTNVTFSVIDTGIGIHSDKHEKIFEMFGQAESDTTRKYGGTGLGLSIVKQVLTLFGSDIELESSLGHGTRFFFTIPFDTTVVATEMYVDEASSVDLSHLKILIAEDNDVNRVILKKQLSRLNVQAVMVENGEEAYKAHLGQDFDAIFMDLHMPVLGGYDTTRKIRMLDSAKAHVHIIAFTASVTEQQDILSGGFDDYLYKPVNMHDLREKLEKIAMMTKMHTA